jgi:hypothetical protein
LVCGQNGCPLDYLSFQSLKNHCVKHHGLAAAEEQAGEKSSSSVGSANAVECENINSPSEAENINSPSEVFQTLLGRIHSNGGILKMQLFSYHV